MSMTDPIADFLTRIRNGDPGRPRDGRHPRVQAQGRAGADPRASRATSTATRSRRRPPSTPARSIRDHAEVHRRPPVGDLGPAARLAPGPAHATSTADDIPKVQGGMGTAIVSTSNGVMTGHEARQRGRRRRGRGGGLVAAMSRIGKQPIPVPAGVTVTIEPERRARQRPQGRALRAHPARHRRSSRPTASCASRARPTAASTAPCTG